VYLFGIHMALGAAAVCELGHSRIKQYSTASRGAKMNVTRRQATIGGLSLLAGTSMSTMSQAHLGELLGIDEGLEEFWLATDAYIYGYPLVTMEMTRRVITNVAAPEGTRAPMGQIIKLRHYPDASFRDVTAPNADTLYTTSFFDVGKEPWVPNAFQVPGKRTTGTGAQTYAITGPGWTGTLPQGVKQLKSPTSSYGSWAAFTASARRRITRPCTRFRTSSSWYR
jgi:hypothetical protein